MAKSKKNVKTKKEKVSSSAEGRSYLFAGILLFLFGAIIFAMNLKTNTDSLRYNDSSQKSIEYLSDMQDELR